MNNVLRSTFGTLVVAAFLAITSSIYAHGGHGGGHGGHGGQHGGRGNGHAVRGHAAGHVTAAHAGFRARGGRVQRFARVSRGNARYALRAYNWNGGRYWGGRNWGGSYWYPSYGYSRFGYYGVGYGYPYYGYYPWGYYPYRYGYWPYLSFSIGFTGY